ncbi:MAG: B12-binding domain-containing radical SAM protein [Candidatus Omnitrophica bacterium]|nr:B12-binding domain-containing radical SAM protein [Candidatus Omnitrophota bacterium]
MKVLLVVYDNASYIHTFPQGTAYIAAVLQKEGHQVSIYNQDVYHYPDEHLTGYLNENKFDLVGLGIIAGYYQYRKLLAISRAINKSKNRPLYILGGHGPSPEPEYFLKKTRADIVVIGEGEETIVELLRAKVKGSSLKPVKGIAFRQGEKVTVNERRLLIADVDSLPYPAYDLFPIEYYRLIREMHSTNSDFVMPVLSGRGCPFHCNFCYRMDEGFRPRKIEAIIDEIELLKRKYLINYIGFSDELLMSSVQRTEDICRAFIKAKLNIKWYCNGRLNYAKPGLLKLMKQAGCAFINYGIEAVDDEVLKNMRKVLTVRQITEGIENTLKAKISPGFNIIFGNIGDNKKTLKRGVEFLLKYDDAAQMRTIRPVTPYPGSPLYYYAIEKGLLRDCEDFYENKHLNSDLLAVNFTDLSDEEFHCSLMRANMRLLKNYFRKKLLSVTWQCEDLYLNRNINFRGFRKV